MPLNNPDIGLDRLSSDVLGLADGDSLRLPPHSSFPPYVWGGGLQFGDSIRVGLTDTGGGLPDMGLRMYPIGSNTMVYWDLFPSAALGVAIYAAWDAPQLAPAGVWAANSVVQFGSDGTSFEIRAQAWASAKLQTGAVHKDFRIYKTTGLSGGAEGMSSNEYMRFDFLNGTYIWIGPTLKFAFGTTGAGNTETAIWQFVRTATDHVLAIQPQAGNSSMYAKIGPSGTSRLAGIEIWNDNDFITTPTQVGSYLSLDTSTSQHNFRGLTSGGASAIPISFSNGGSTAFTIGVTGVVSIAQLSDVSYSNGGILQFRGGAAAAGSGAYVVLAGKTHAQVGNFKLATPDAAGTGDVTRLLITGVAATVIATWSSVYHVGMKFGLAGTATGAFTIDGATSGVVTVTVNAVAGTWTLTLPAAVGTAGFQLTDAGGTGVTSWASAASLREYKSVRGEHSSRDALDKILRTKVYDFHYKPGMGTQDTDTLYTGIMAEDAPWAMHYQGGILNPVNSFGYTVLAFQAMAEQVALALGFASWSHLQRHVASRKQEARSQ